MQMVQRCKNFADDFTAAALGKKALNATEDIRKN